MTDAQAKWWRQTQSDWSVFVHLRRAGVNTCHLLHYLQMTTEKLGKAYLWRSGRVPSKNHTGFVRFLKALLDRRPAELDHIAKVLGFNRAADLETWVGGVQTLAYALQNMAPAEANNGPNPEYPWPHEAPTTAPCDHEFALWSDLVNTGRGRKLTKFIEVAVSQFPAYA